MVLIAMGLAVPGAGRDPRGHARWGSSRRGSCARTAATRSSCIAVVAVLLPGQDPVTMLLADGPAARALRGLYPAWPRCSTAAQRARRAREEAERGPRATTATTTSRTDSMLFDLRGSGRRRTVKIVYITLAFLMGGGLVLFGIGGGGASRAASSTRSPAQRRRRHRRPTASTSTRRPRSQGTQANPQDAAAWAALARARYQLAGAGDNFDPNTGHLHQTAGKAQLASAGDAWEQLPRARPEEARRPRREPDGPGLRPPASTSPPRPSRRRRSSPTPDPTRDDLHASWRSSPTRPARPARATSRRRGRSS